MEKLLLRKILKSYALMRQNRGLLNNGRKSYMMPSKRKNMTVLKIMDYIKFDLN